MNAETLKHLPWNILGANGETSTIHQTTHKGKIIIKKQLNPEYKQEYLNELSCLQALQASKHFPTLYAHDDDHLILYMSYCGKRLYPRTKPRNWEEQINNIIQIIYDKDIIYSDIKIDHLRVHNDNTIRLIDFGRATVGPQKRKQDIHKFYDLAKNVIYE